MPYTNEEADNYLGIKMSYLSVVQCVYQGLVGATREVSHQFDLTRVQTGCVFK